MLSPSPRSGGTQDPLVVGRPAPADPLHHLLRGDSGARHGGPGPAREQGARQGPGAPGTDLTGPGRPGKFYQVAPQPGRKATLRCAFDP
jgi:hypothetical protein